MSFLLGPGLFSGAMSVSFREGIFLGGGESFLVPTSVGNCVENFKVETCESTRNPTRWEICFLELLYHTCNTLRIGEGKIWGLGIFFGGVVLYMLILLQCIKYRHVFIVYFVLGVSLVHFFVWLIRISSTSLEQCLGPICILKSHYEASSKPWVVP